MKAWFTLPLIVSSLALGALPPFYQSAREIKAVLDDASVAEKFGSGKAIEGINKDPQESTYYVASKDCFLAVKVVYGESTQPGPVPFTLEVGNLTCE